MSTQTLDDLFSELQAGAIEKQILDALKKTAFNTVNINGDKVPKAHTGEITLKITISNGTKADTINIASTVKTRIPTINGKGHAIFVEDGQEDLFFVDPKNGYISINPIMQDDAEYQSRGNVSPIFNPAGK